METNVVPGSTIGILGGGQLGRMLALAAARLGLKTHVLSPDPNSPAFAVCGEKTIASYDDEKSLAAFAAEVNVVTYEFENVPAGTAAILAKLRPVRPGPASLAVSQDRLVEKEFIASLGIATAPFLAVDDAGALARAIGQLGRPSILKTRRFGYDGKGQTLVKEGSDLAVTFRSLGGAPAILEGVVPFSKEISVICARGIGGDFAAFDVCENWHDHHILSFTRAPAEISSELAKSAVKTARHIADSLDYVGVLAVEMFVVENPKSSGNFDLKVNEIAPRVHNSGHWTEAGALTSQFEQHIRAICGWPLGSVARHGAWVEMRNIIGADAANWAEILADPCAHLHLYGKTEASPGRKMGHVTRIRY